jgi:hypothetical protein
VRDLIEQVLMQGKKLEALTSRTNAAQAKLREASDRVFYSLQDSFTFQQGQNVVQNLLFNVPASDDFEAVRLSFYPFVRRVAVEDLPAGTTNDLTFRPTVWSFQDVTTSLAYYAVDALVELVTALPDGSTRRYQNAAFTMYQTFSAYTSPLTSTANTAPFGLQGYDRSESPSALVFDPCWHLPKGSTVTARVTPLFSGERLAALTAADGLINEYQIRGVLEGYKRAR